MKSPLPHLWNAFLAFNSLFFDFSFSIMQVAAEDFL